MQKLLTIYISDAKSPKHGAIEEHLEQYMAEGWRIKKIDTLGGTHVQGALSGWIVVMIERNDLEDGIPF